MKNKKRLLLALIILVLAAAAVFVIVMIGRNNTGGDAAAGNGAAIPAAISYATAGTRSVRLDENWHAIGDDDGLGLVKEWYKSFPSYGDPIEIPGTARDVTDAISVWYANTFTADFDLQQTDRIFVRLSGITYSCDAWLNGVSLGQTHEGGNDVFYLEATDMFRNGAENTLVLRVVAPQDTSYGQVNTGKPRIAQPIYVYAAQDVVASDVYVEPNCNTGDIRVSYTLDNPYDSDRTASVVCTVYEDGKRMPIERIAETVTAASGQSMQELVLRMDGFQYWSPEEPNLYTVHLTVNGETVSVTTGYKTLRIDDDGYFELNGERYYIKSTHLVAQYAGSYDTSRELELIYQELVYLKSCGFNTVRFLMNGALEQQIAICDRIGLIVYEESPAAWKVTDSDITEEQFHKLTSAVLLRDRNHVSLGMFGMLNETKNEGNTKRSYAAAVAELPRAREIAPNVLMLLSSARWDGDKSLASAANPGESEWKAWMGQEGEGGDVSTVNDLGYTGGMGDLHLYPPMPYGSSARAWFEGVGKTGRAAFLSEAGAGSQANVIGEYLNLQEKNVSKLSFEYKFLKPQVDLIHSVYEEYGCDRVFGSAERMLIASQELQSSQRALLFDYIRSNERINGYSMTMSTDTGFTGEGILTMYGQYKPDMTEVLQQGWADLRWCIMTDKPVYCNGDTMRLDVCLSDVAHVLDPNKEYPVTLRISGDGGTVWTQDVTVKTDGTFVLDVFRGEVKLNESLPAGSYRLTAAMTGGAHPLADERTFHVLKRNANKLNGVICTLNVRDDVRKLLTDNGAVVTDDPDSAVILVGAGELSAETIRMLCQKAAGGAHVVFLDASALTSGDDSRLRLPLDSEGRLAYQYDWLYHKEHLVFDTALTDGMEEKCLLDPYYYGDVYANNYVSGMAVPDSLAVMVFSAGLTTWDADGVIAGYQLGTYDFYEGSITINTLKLLDGCGKPVADRLISNIMAQALQTGVRPGAPSPEALEKIASRVK